MILQTETACPNTAAFVSSSPSGATPRCSCKTTSIQTKDSNPPTAETSCSGQRRTTMYGEGRVSRMKRVKLLQIKLRAICSGKAIRLCNTRCAEMYICLHLYWVTVSDSSLYVPVSCLWFLLIKLTDVRSPEASVGGEKKHTFCSPSAVFEKAE